MEKNVSISESELQVMKVIWEESPQTLKDILIKLNHTGWSTTTIQTYLARLVKKKALITQRMGKGFLYYPAISESECLLAESKHFLHRIYDGSLAKMVSCFIKSGNLSKSELESLKELIKQQEKQQ